MLEPETGLRRLKVEQQGDMFKDSFRFLFCSSEAEERSPPVISSLPQGRNEGHGFQCSLVRKVTGTPDCRSVRS